MDPNVLLFTDSHEWIEATGEIRKVGISQHAQEMLGDIVYVELPKVGRTVSQKEEFLTVESPKAASGVYAPMSGEVVEVNEAIEGNPGTINQAPYNEGWLVKIRVSNTTEAAALLRHDAYLKSVEAH